ncbi:hypothetical protein GCM10022402_33880 [Salinactinospora qingdaonensis]|uniref:Uncharacterized protein n=1 Tax=Salinactinospora qingdaonensis TaxID=702744 RepID=A0ABP7FZ30_9ACTN
MVCAGRTVTEPAGEDSEGRKVRASDGERGCVSVVCAGEAAKANGEWGRWGGGGVEVGAAPR